MKLALILAGLTSLVSAVAIPEAAEAIEERQVASAGGQVYFSMASNSPAGTELSGAPFVANNYAIYIGKMTTKGKCPSKGSCPKGLGTNFKPGAGNTLYMGATEKQQVYINKKNGALHYTKAGILNTNGGVTAGFDWTGNVGNGYGVVRFFQGGVNKGFAACPVSGQKEVFQIYANINGASLPSGCAKAGFTHIGGRTENSTHPNAYSYV